MTKNERLEQLADLLHMQKHLPVRKLAEHFEVSEMTIRRDLDILKDQLPITVMNGIGIYEDTMVKIGQAYHLSQEEQSRLEDKLTIGRFAASLIKPNEIIFLDVGSTTVHIAENLPTDFPLSVICNAANIFLELYKKDNVSIKLAGGAYQPSTAMFTSLQGIEYIERFRVSKMFMSAAGIHPKLGVTCSVDYLVRSKRHAMDISVEKILVADASKFGIVHSSYCCKLSDVDAIITNKSLSQEWQNLIADYGIKLYLV